MVNTTAYPDAVRFLNCAWEIQQEIDLRLSQIESLRARAFRYNAVLDGMPKAGSRSRGLETVLARTADMEAELADLAADGADQFEQVRAVLGRMKAPIPRIVLEYRYLYGFPWKAIVQQMSYSRRRLLEYHLEGLKEVDGILREENLLEKEPRNAIN